MLSDAAMGWIFVAGACICFGSFGLPIKHPSVINANVHPLAYQTYKSFWCFATSWLVLLWHPLNFTCWGFVSAAFWVPAGVAAVVSITNCGMAVGQGVWTTLIVIVSFIWGAAIFQEEFKSLGLACLGAALIIFGAIGMTCFGIKKEDEHASEPSIGSFAKLIAERPKVDDTSELPAVPQHAAATIPASSKTCAMRRHPSMDVESADQQVASIGEETSHIGSLDSMKSMPSTDTTDSDELAHRLLNTESSGEHIVDATAAVEDYKVGDHTTWQGRSDVFVEICGVRMHRRTYGILAAVFNGCYGGSVMAPLKFAGGSASGISFVISFGVGVLGITSFMWFAWWVAYHLGLVKEGIPSLQLRVMLIPGTISGLLWATGNLCSIYAVLYLGQAIGYSSCQANIAISGAWGIFYYQEQISRKRIFLFFTSASVAIAGIAVLTVAK